MAKIKEEELRPFEILPLNQDVLGNLSIEELEERLEMQLLHVSEGQICFLDFLCFWKCNECNNTCTCQGVHVCNCEGTNSGNPCQGHVPVCAECVTLCNFNGTCLVDGDGDGDGSNG